MIIENRTFRLKDGTDEVAFLDADHRFQIEFANLQPGIVRRTTSRGADGEWLVVTFWGSMDDAAAADERAKHDAAAQAFASLIDGVSVSRYETLD